MEHGPSRALPMLGAGAVQRLEQALSVTELGSQAVNGTPSQVHPSYTVHMRGESVQ